ncbi:MAG: hypothetical protein JXI33_05780 [Candidatus Aminicenantes bacterium]|nr:hypothetical protein [Candidatus Aminicenantes bacterium]
MKKTMPFWIILLVLAHSSVAVGKIAPLSALKHMPVKEVTVFKDGHAFVLHEGKLPVDSAGNVCIDYLPAPVLGTFWPYSASREAKLTAVVAGQRRVLVERTALTLRELLEANSGARVTLTEKGGLKYPATILNIPKRSGQELEAMAAPGAEPTLPEKGVIGLFKTQDGVKVVDIGHIQDITFISGHRPTLEREEFRNLLTLKFNWNRQRPERETVVGLVYLQRGLRWIPAYRIELDGNGGVTLKLQATLVNDLTDLEDASVNLVVGVPNFVFADLVDPIALEKETAALAPRLQSRSQTNFAFSNAIMTQVATADASSPGSAPETGPEINGAEMEADLCIFAISHVTLRKGERMVIPVAEATLKYQDRYHLEVPIAPPRESFSSFDESRHAELTRLLAAPKVQHGIRFVNSGPHPFTTAPALIGSQGRLIAQNMMKYTPVGAAAELDLTAAVDVLIKKQEREIRRTPHAVHWNGSDYFKVELEGTLTLTNRKKERISVEVVRHVLGNTDSADFNGKIEKVNSLEDSVSAGAPRPHWWSWYSWPSWWSHFNSIARISWKISLAPGERQVLSYTWHYYWR